MATLHYLCKKGATTVSIATFNIIGLNRDTQHNDAQDKVSLSVTFLLVC